jgi:hypothetical protein
MKLKNVDIGSFTQKLVEELQLDVHQSIDRLEELKALHLKGRPARNINDVTDSNILELLNLYQEFSASIEKWIAQGRPSSKSVGLFSLFDLEDQESGKVTTCFVTPFDRFPSEIVRVDGYEKDRLVFRKSYNVLGFPVKLLESNNDLMGLEEKEVHQLQRKHNKSANWTVGAGGDRGDYTFSGQLKSGKVLYIYSIS